MKMAEDLNTEVKEKFQVTTKNAQREKTEGQDSVKLEVDCFPGPKERRKALSKVMTRMYMYLHDLNWAGFDQYTKELSYRHPADYDLKAVLCIYQADRLKNSGNYKGAMNLFPNIERLLASSRSPECLGVRYLTTKAFTLHFMGKQKESVSLQQQAVQMTSLQLPSNPTAYNLTIYALHGCLHRSDDDGNSIIPTDEMWLKAEHYYHLGCEQHLKWILDLEEDCKIPESVSSSFFLFSFVRYIFTLVRSCVAGGFVYFDKHHTTKEKLMMAEKCIEKVKCSNVELSVRTKFEFALVQCDYFLRIAELESAHNKYKCFNKAQQFAHSALSTTRKLMDRNHAKFNRTFADVRLRYIRFQVKHAHITALDDTFGCDPEPYASSNLGHMHHYKSLTPNQEVSGTAIDEFDVSGSAGILSEFVADEHRAGCLECAVRQTQPKELTVFDLQLEMDKSPECPGSRADTERDVREVVEQRLQQTFPKQRCNHCFQIDIPNDVIDTNNV